jgi:hypothetical protein
MVWTFSPALSEKGRKLLDQRLQAKYNSARSDFGVYQREKKKKMQEKNREKTTVVGKAAATPATAVKRKGTASTLVPPAPQAPAKGPKDAEAKTFDSFTTSWTDSAAEKPMLISSFPEGGSFYEYYFTLDFSEWVKFDLEGALADESAHFDS